MQLHLTTFSNMKTDRVYITAKIFHENTIKLMKPPFPAKDCPIKKLMSTNG